MPDPYLTEIGWAGTALRLAGRLKGDATVPPAPGIELHLRERESGGLLRLPAAVRATDGVITFEVRVDVASVEGGHPLPGGLWDVDLAIQWPAGEVTVPFGRDRAPGLDTSPQRRFLPDSTVVAAYFGAQGALAIDVGGRPHVAGSTTADRVGWNERDEGIVISGHIDAEPAGMPISGTLILLERDTRQIYEVIAMLGERPGGLGYTAQIPVTRSFIDDPLPRGAWDVSLCLGFSGMHRELAVLAPEEPVDVQVRRRQLHVRVASTTAPDPLTITVGRA